MNTTTKNNLTEEVLIADFVKSRDLGLFEEIYNRFSKLVFNSSIYFLKNEKDAEDAAQEIFIRLFLNIHKYSGKSKFSTWLRALTYNHCINIITRERKNQSQSVDEICGEYLVDDQVADDEQILALQLEILSKALEQISPQQKMILLLRYKDGMSIKELADFFQIGESAVKMRLNRSKQNLLITYKRIEDEFK